MTIALFSDIHANLPALEAVLADMDQRRPDMIYCLGDLVGYAPWPNEVAAEIRRRGIPTLAGNYDEGIGKASDDCGCAYKTDDERSNGAVSISYTNQVVTEETRRYLHSLPAHLSMTFGQPTGPQVRLLMVHGSPRRINEYLFEDRDERSLLRILHDAGSDVLAFGHTHKPYHRVLQDADGRYRHAINIGSVGKPKDGDPRACYALLHLDHTLSAADPASLQVEFLRVPYDVERAAAAIEASPLPNAYAEALRLAQ